MLEVLWVAWIVVVLPLALLAWFVPQARRLTGVLVVLALAGPLAFILWLTQGRVVLSCAVGSVLAALVVAVFAARRTGVAQLPSLLRALWRSVLVYGLLIGAGIEAGGRWSGSDFVLWRAVLGGGLVLLAGVGLLLWSGRRQER